MLESMFVSLSFDAKESTIVSTLSTAPLPYASPVEPGLCKHAVLLSSLNEQKLSSFCSHQTLLTRMLICCKRPQGLLRV